MVKFVWTTDYGPDLFALLHHMVSNLLEITR